MRLQQASRLAIYALLALAAEPDRQISAAEIATTYGASLNHLAKVMRDLGRAGLVESARGAGGGFRFSGNPKRTTLLDVIELFETLGGGTAGITRREVNTDAGLGLDVVLGEIDDIARSTLGSITIATMLKLIERQKRRRLPIIRPAGKPAAKSARTRKRT
jgi:Rrf2 family nitric oxide-sensitive transcriptional repressor